MACLNREKCVEQQHLKRAIALSRQKMLAGEGGPFAAVVVRQGQVVAEGWNRVTSSCDPSAHAEIEAIRQACAKLQTHVLVGYELYSSCEPCPMCLAACYWARLDRIYYAASRADANAAGFDDHAIGEQLCMAAAERHLPMQQALRSDAVEVFDEWLHKADRIPY